MAFNRWIAGNILHPIENIFDRSRHGIKRNLNLYRPLTIVPYRTYGTQNKVYLHGRVLQAQNLRRPAPSDTAMQNLRSVWQRFRSPEVPGVTVKASVKNCSTKLVTNDEGFFEGTLDVDIPEGETGWVNSEFSIVEGRGHKPAEVASVGLMKVPSAAAQFGIISDLDDTVLQTNVVNVWRMFQTTFFHNAHTRLPFEGVAAFYNALYHGTSSTDSNPIFYVSSSPWNLYDFLEEFLNYRDIPPGPLLLKDYGLTKNNIFSGGHHNHKLNHIERILATYPEMQFILIGDSGQQDPMIYRQAVHDFPGRVLCCYIRMVGRDKHHTQARMVAESLKEKSVEMILVKDTLEAAEHAAAKGFIEPATLAGIQLAMEKDKNIFG